MLSLWCRRKAYIYIYIIIIWSSVVSEHNRASSYFLSLAAEWFHFEENVFVHIKPETMQVHIRVYLVNPQGRGCCFWKKPCTGFNTFAGIINISINKNRCGEIVLLLLCLLLSLCTRSQWNTKRVSWTAAFTNLISISVCSESLKQTTRSYKHTGPLLQCPTLNHLQLPADNVINLPLARCVNLSTWLWQIEPLSLSLSLFLCFNKATRMRQKAGVSLL